MKRTLIAIMLALALVLIPAGSAFAQPPTVTVTAVPGFLSLAVLPTAWTINGVGPLLPPAGDSIIRTNTPYYSNPVGDLTPPSSPVVAGECSFTFTNNSNVPINITCAMSDFTATLPGGDTMTNINTGYAFNGVGQFGASGYAVGVDLPGVIFDVAGSLVFITNLIATGTQDWGVALLTRQNAFTSIIPMTSTITCTASYWP